MNGVHRCCSIGNHVGGLDPITFPNTANFARECDLTCFIADVLDDGVAEGEVE